MSRNRWIWTGVGMLLGLVGLAGAAQATSFDDKPKLLLHLRPVTTKNDCTVNGNLSDCTQAVTKGTLSQPVSGPFYYVYLLAANGRLRGSEIGGAGAGVAGLQCGIAYNGRPQEGVDIFGWHLCASLEFAEAGWPASGTGNLITWDTTTRCQKGEVSIAGYFYCAAYTYDRFNLTARPVDNLTKVADCQANEFYLDSQADLGIAEFSAAGSVGSCNPCLGQCAGDPWTPDDPTPPTVTATCAGVHVGGGFFDRVPRFPTYYIYRDGQYLAQVDAAEYLDTQAPPGEHCYSYSYYSGYYWSALSSAVCVTPLSPPHPQATSALGAAPGDTVTIAGTGFGGPNPGVNAVRFTGDAWQILSAELLSWTDELIRCIVPAEAVTGPVTLVNSCGQATLGFTPVVVSNLLATAVEDGVVLTWDAADDGGAVGFNVYRRAASGERVRLNAAPLAVAARNRFFDAGLSAPGHYVYALEEVQRAGGVIQLGEIAIDYAGPAGAPGIAAIRPNPARDNATISYRLKTAAAIQLAVFDVQGRRVATLVDEFIAAGAHSATWDARAADGTRAAPGLYLVRLNGPGVRVTAKLMLAR